MQGIVCLTIAVLLMVADARFPLATAALFGLDPLITYDEHYCSPDEVGNLTNNTTKSHTPQSPKPLSSEAYELIEMGASSESINDIDVVDGPNNEPCNKSSQVLILRRRGTSLFLNPSQVVLHRPVQKNESSPVESIALDNPAKNDSASSVVMTASPGP